MWSSPLLLHLACPLLAFPLCPSTCDVMWSSPLRAPSCVPPIPAATIPPHQLTQMRAGYIIATHYREIYTNMCMRKLDLLQKDTLLPNSDSKVIFWFGMGQGNIRIWRDRCLGKGIVFYCEQSFKPLIMCSLPCTTRRYPSNQRIAPQSYIHLRWRIFISLEEGK